MTEAIVIFVAVAVIAAVARYRSLPGRYDPWRDK